MEVSIYVRESEAEKQEAPGIGAGMGVDARFRTASYSKGGDLKMENRKLDLSLDLADLEAEEIQVMAIADARGLPEMGASRGQMNCCTNVKPNLEESEESTVEAPEAT